MKILIVEDELLVAALAEECLKRDGYKIVGIASSGEDAIELTGKHKPDLIIMDIFLKGDIDGVETAEYINKHHSIPIIYVTGNTDSKTFERANNTRHYGYYEKPFSSKSLRKAVRETFELIRFKEESTRVM